MKHFLKLAVSSVLMVGLAGGLFGNGLNLNGNGSKAVGMGGAFVGLADDFSAVFWNPAGLIQMKKSNLSIFITDVIPTGTYQLGVMGIDTTTETKHYFSGGIGYFKPISDKLVIGIYGYVPSGIGAVWNGADLAVLSSRKSYDWKSFFGVLTISPAVAFKITDTLTLGATINFNYGMLKLDKPGLGQYHEDANGFAMGATLGMLFKPSDLISIGLTYKLPIKANLKGTVEMSGAPLMGLNPSDDSVRETKLPMWLAAGIALKPNDKLTITADAQYTNWKKLDVIPMSYSNVGWKTYLESASDLHLNWKNATQIRFGLEYKLSESFALRGGYYNDPLVSPKSTQNILLPEVSYNWITVGFGYKTASMTLDASVEYGIGKDVEVGLLDGGMPGIHGMNVLCPNISFTFNL